MPSDKERLNFMLEKVSHFKRYLDGWKAWGFVGCSLVDPQKTKIAAIDAAIRASKKKGGRDK